jgi:hypothetical protein
VTGLYDRKVQGSLFSLPLSVIAVCAAAAVLVLVLETWKFETGFPFLLSTTVAGGRAIIKDLVDGTEAAVLARRVEAVGEEFAMTDE